MKRMPVALALQHKLRRRQPEKTEQAAMVQLLSSVGGKVYVLGTRRSRFARCTKCGALFNLVGKQHFSTRQTPGVSDVLAFLPPRGGDTRWVLVWVEAKAEGGRLSLDQTLFRQLCLLAEVPHVVGGLDDVIAWLVGLGYLRRDQVAHYRLRAASTNQGGD